MLELGLNILSFKNNYNEKIIHAAYCGKSDDDVRV
jgi:hypothetical protein